MESALRRITHHLCVAAAKEFVPHLAEDLHGRLVVRAIALPRHALGEPVLSERPDVRRMPVLPAHAIDRMGCAPPRATPAWQPPTRPCASTTRVFGHLPDDQRSPGVCWAGACALPNVSAAPFTLFAMANELVFAGARIAWNGGATGMSGLSPDEDGLAGIGAGAAVGHLRARVHIAETRGVYIEFLGRAVRALPPRGLSR